MRRTRRPIGLAHSIWLALILGAVALPSPAQGTWSRVSDGSGAASSACVSGTQIAWIEDGRRIVTRAPYSAPARVVHTAAAATLGSLAVATGVGSRPAEFTFTDGDEVWLLLDGASPTRAAQLVAPRVVGPRHGIATDPATGTDCLWSLVSGALATLGHVGPAERIVAAHSLDGRTIGFVVRSGASTELREYDPVRGTRTLLAAGQQVELHDLRQFWSAGGARATAVLAADAHGRRQIGVLRSGTVQLLTSGDGDHRVLGAWSTPGFSIGAGALLSIVDSPDGPGLALGRTHRRGGDDQFLGPGAGLAIRGRLDASADGQLVCVTAELPAGSTPQVWRWRGPLDHRIEPIAVPAGPGSRLEIEVAAAAGEIATLLLGHDLGAPLRIPGVEGRLLIARVPGPFLLWTGVGTGSRTPLTGALSVPNDPDLRGRRFALQSVRIGGGSAGWGRYGWLPMF